LRDNATSWTKDDMEDKLLKTITLVEFLVLFVGWLCKETKKASKSGDTFKQMNISYSGLALRTSMISDMTILKTDERFLKIRNAFNKWTILKESLYFMMKM
jgi:hypothetical protein